MVKRILQLYVDAEAIALAKAQNINLSALFREMLDTRLSLKNTKDVQKELEVKVAQLTANLTEKNKEVEKLKKELKENGKPSGNIRRIHL